MGSSDNRDTEISQATDGSLINDGYRSSGKVTYTLQMLKRILHLFCIQLSVSSLLHILKSDPLSPKANICRKLLAGDSLAFDKLSPSLITRTKGVMIKSNMVETLTSYFSTFRADTGASLDIQTAGCY